MTPPGRTGCLSVKRRAPSCAATVNLALVAIDGVQTLVWSRSNGLRED